MVESTIDKIKDITVERQMRKLAGIIDEQNDTISKYGDATTDIQNLKDSDANQTNQINNLKSDVAKNTTATENLNNRVTSVEQDITNTESEITSVKSAITNLQAKDSAQDVTLATHDSQIQGITESLVSDVQILDGITTGDIKVRIDREDAASIDSNSYNLGLPVSAEIIQGTGPSMFKVQITMSSGVKVVSNDFVFTTEAIGTDVYISSFTFKAGNQDGYLSADIGLNNGVTIEANNFLVPTDPNVIANITDLQTRMTNVENTSISDNRITAIETKNTEQDTAIQQNATDISSLNSEVSGVMSDLDTKVAISQGTGNAGKVLGIGSDGNVTPTEISSGGFEVYTGDLADLFEITDTSFVTKKDIIVRLTRGSFKYGTWSTSTPTAVFFFPKSGKEWISNGTGRGTITQSNLMLYNGFKKYACDLDPDGTIIAYSCDINGTTWSESNISYAKNDTIDNRLNTEKIPNGDGSGFTAGNGGYITLYTVYTK